MEESNYAIIDFVFYSSLVRDLLSYMVNEKYDMRLFKNQQQCLKSEIVTNSYLRKFLDTVGEEGQVFIKNAQELYSVCFEDKEAFLKVEDNAIIVNKKRNLEVLTYLTRLECSLLPAINAEALGLKAKNNMDEEVDELVKNNYIYTVATQLLCIYLLIEKTFKDFNNLYHTNPKDIANLQGMKKLNFDLINQYELVKYFAKLSDSSYYKQTIGKIDDAIEKMLGKKECLANETMEKVMSETRKSAISFLIITTDPYRQSYSKMMTKYATMLQERAKRN